MSKDRFFYAVGEKKAKRKAKQKVENDEAGSNVPLLHGGIIDDGRQG